MIKDNLVEIENLILHSQSNSAVHQDVTLVAVSKNKPANMIKEAYDLGIRDFGENKVQEILDKFEKLPSDIRWHMIGHLQRNKVKYIIDKVAMIHSVDSLRLAQEINKEALKKNICMPILIEINIANETSKFGINLNEVETFMEELSKLKGIVVKGFMTVAPFVHNSEDNRKYFKQLYELFVDIRDKNIDNISICCLSMGMTGDYQIAIEEGSTMVRIGTGIFGNRTYE